MNNLFIKITNGSKIHIENMSHLLENRTDEFWFREIRIKETELELYTDHFIYDWSKKFYESKNLPDWIIKSQLLEFEVVHS
jgi:hypothetical protein